MFYVHITQLEGPLWVNSSFLFLSFLLVVCQGDGQELYVKTLSFNRGTASDTLCTSMFRTRTSFYINIQNIAYHKNSYYSQPPQPAVVYSFGAGVLFSIVK